VNVTRTALVVVIASALLSGCGLLRGNTVGSGAPTVMTVNSTAFSQSTMPAQYTCYTSRVTTPPLTWSGAPSATKSFAIVLDDSSAPITPYIYWLVFDISAATSSIAQGQLPPGALQAQNSSGHAAYNPPCPSGHSHFYRFTVYALNKTLNLTSGTSLKTAWTAIAAATIGRGRIPVKANP
jgi:Raf kinase inhibitor-like YbhB/YbcL family protein